MSTAKAEVIYLRIWIVFYILNVLVGEVLDRVIGIIIR